MAGDNHDEWSVLENEYRRLREEREEGKITKQDAEAIKEFLEHDRGKNKLTTVRGHATNLRTAARRADVPLMESTEDDLNNLLSTMRSGSHPDVKDDGIGVSNYQKVFRVFYRYHSEMGVTPEEIEIDKERGRQVQPSDLLTQDDVDKLLSHCFDIRDRAFITLALATGQRIDAIRTLRLKHVTIHDKTMDIRLNEEEGTLKGASGSKPLLWSKHYVKSWYDNHPYQDNPEAALFCSKPDAPLPEDREPHGPLHYQTIRNRLHRIGEKAGIEPEKKVYSHLLRHTAITRMVLEGLNEQKIKKIVGWSADSSQFETYVSLADDLSNDAIREELGLPTEDDLTVLGRPTLERCPNCNDQLPDGSEICSTCNTPISNTGAEQTDTEQSSENPIKDALRSVFEENEQEKAQNMFIEAVEEVAGEVDEGGLNPD